MTSKELEKIFAEMDKMGLLDEVVDLSSHIGVDGKKEYLAKSKKGGSWEDWNDIVFSGEKNQGKRQ